MTSGVVRDSQACVNVVFHLPGSPDFAIECVVDTGFAGALTLPPEVIQRLQLPFFQEIDANLANDANVKTSVHVATVLWDEQEIEVAVLAMGRRPLLGTALIEGKRLYAEFVEGGVVTIDTY